MLDAAWDILPQEQIYCFLYISFTAVERIEGSLTLLGSFLAKVMMSHRS